MNKPWPFGGVLVLTLLALASCQQNYYTKLYFRSLEYYFPDSQLRSFAVAAAEGKTDVLESLTASKEVEVDQPGSEGMTALAWAVGSQNLVGVDWLLTHGARPDRNFYDGLTPLVVAVTLNDRPIAARLLKAGAEPDLQVNALSSPMERAVVYADVAMVELLVDNAANVNGGEGNEGRPLIKALANNKYDIAALLLERKADPRLLPNMESWIVDWMQKNRDKRGTELAFQQVEKLLEADGVKLSP